MLNLCFKPRRTQPHQPSTHTYRLFKFLKNTAAHAAKKRNSDRPTHYPSTTPAKHQHPHNRKTTTPSLARTAPAGTAPSKRAADYKVAI